MKIHLIRYADVVLVARTYADHWDGQARKLVPKGAPILRQPEDEAAISGTGLANVSSLSSEAEWKGWHGTGEIGA